jgi:hypothetical protein
MADGKGDAPDGERSPHIPEIVVGHGMRLSGLTMPNNDFRITLKRGAVIDLLPYRNSKFLCEVDLTDLCGECALPSELFLGYHTCRPASGSQTRDDDGCRSLRRVIWPTGLRSVGRGCFERSGLMAVDFRGTRVAFLADDAFSRCERLNRLHVPNTIEEIRARCFYSTALSRVRLPHCRGLKLIDSLAFGDCRQLACVVLPCGALTVSSTAFVRCSGLDEIDHGPCIGEQAHSGAYFGRVRHRVGDVPAVRVAVVRTGEAVRSPSVYRVRYVVAAGAAGALSGLVGIYGMVVRPLPPNA